MIEDLPLTAPAARKAGSRFYVGLECSTHEDSPRYTANGRCVECCKAERKAAAPANRERDAERKRMARLAGGSVPRMGKRPINDFADLLG